MTSPETITAAITPELRQLVRQVRYREGVATIIADAAGLGRSAAAQLERELEEAARGVEGVTEVRVALMTDRGDGPGGAPPPSTSPATASPAPQAASAPASPERQIVLVGSGKGGVGKSTLTANLAAALARAGAKVGVVDADIYGPSQVMLLDAQRQRPRAAGQTLIPVESEFGVRLLSMAQLIEGGKAIAWRGPMVGQALAQLMNADWGDTELLLVDLPPGTGDVQLTMMQKFKPAGAIVVSTPQDLALLDATRAIDLFRQANTPIIGLVENMAGYICPHCGEFSDPFGQGGTEAAARALGEAFLGRVPLEMAIRVASDTGQPPAANEGAAGEPFRAIAARLAGWLAEKDAQAAGSATPGGPA